MSAMNPVGGTVEEQCSKNADHQLHFLPREDTFPPVEFLDQDPRMMPSRDGSAVMVGFQAVLR